MSYWINNIAVSKKSYSAAEAALEINIEDAPDERITGAGLKKF